MAATFPGKKLSIFFHSAVHFDSPKMLAYLCLPQSLLQPLIISYEILFHAAANMPSANHTKRK